MAAATGSPLTLDVNGRTFTLAPLSMRSWGSVERWVRAQYVSIVRDSYAEAPVDERVEAVDRALVRSATFTLAVVGKKGYEDDAKIFQSMISSPMGILQLTFISLRQVDPTVTLDDAEFLLENSDDPVVIMDTVLHISGSPVDNQVTPGKKTRPRKHQTSKKSYGH